MTEPTGRRVRGGYTPVDPDKFVHIDRPSDASLRGAMVVGFVLAIGAGASAAAFVVVLFDPAEDWIYLVAALIGASLALLWSVRSTLRSGRRRREDFVRCGGDPTGMTDMMFGSMRGVRTPEGRWEVPEQGSGDYV
ncbi:hypothetical protein [Cryobacterium sp. N22]|uniref:hypothetical protein n=1 Tax=Cryobacterium sp. N22 TaxID=2048290 RepID=UPI000CE4F004|nr:hypothetical protein [Cryobacterium sp. N22]